MSHGIKLRVKGFRLYVSASGMLPLEASVSGEPERAVSLRDLNSFCSGLYSSTIYKTSL